MYHIHCINAVSVWWLGLCGSCFIIPNVIILKNVTSNSAVKINLEFNLNPGFERQSIGNCDPRLSPNGWTTLLHVMLCVYNSVTCRMKCVYFVVFWNCCIPQTKELIYHYRKPPGRDRWAWRHACANWKAAGTLNVTLEWLFGSWWCPHPFKWPKYCPVENGSIYLKHHKFANNLR